MFVYKKSTAECYKTNEHLNVTIFVCAIVHTHTHKHTQCYVFPLQFTEDGEAPLPEKGVESNVEILNHIDSLFQHGNFSVWRNAPLNW